MTLLDLIQRGSVLTVQAAGNARLLLAPVAEIDQGRLLFYDLTADRARTLKFDRVEWPHDLGAWLIDRGDRVAYLTLASEDSEEAVAAWEAQWLHQPAPEKERLLEVFTEQVGTLKI